MIKSACLALLLLLAFVCSAAAEPVFTAKRGVNLASWVGNARMHPLYARDIAMVESAGFDFVRLPLSPALWGFDPDALDADNPMPQLAELDRAMALLNDSKLKVVLDMHTRTAFRVQMETNEHYQEAMIALWRFLAKRYSAQFSPERLAFQLLNEPQYYKHQAAWNRFQKRLWRTVRLSAPQHTIIASPPIGGNQKLFGFNEMALLPDKNVRYAFPFYEPFIISGQGDANNKARIDIAFPHLKNLAYPAAVARTQDFAVISADIDPKIVERDIAAYLDADWNAAVIKARLGKAAEWAKVRGVSLLLCEFGAMQERIGTDEASRLRYLRDVRTAAEELGIPWAIWGYVGLMGITDMHGKTVIERDLSERFVDPESGYYTFDTGALEALGLHVDAGHERQSPTN